MSPARQRRESEPAARARRALERGATTVGAQLARSVEGGWRRMSPSRRAKLERLAANVRERAVEQRGEADRHTADLDSRGPSQPVADPVVAPAKADSDVSEIEVHDLRADLARELERLADADISAARGPGGVASDAASPDGQT
ncbi:MAG TPA: hypothetical protein VEX36_05600 [Thermoleophilaceae bacterium]|nr:hypothetical protein [Thermoleophilaceae bacterium]